MNWNGAEARPVTVTVPNQASLLDDLESRLREGHGFSVATLNLDHAVKLRKNATFGTAYGEHTHVTADGNPVVWLSRLSGQRDIHLVPGSELILPMAALAERAGAPIALFGATDTSLEAAADVLQATFPLLEVAYRQAPAMGFDPSGDEADAAIQSIGKSGARLVFIALGAPKQEIFAARAQKDLPGVGFLSIGAGLDFVSGAQQRAPKWVQAIAAEWLWRAARNPARLAGRYAACIAALPRLTTRAIASRREVTRP